MRVVAILQARMNSTRLPGKVVLPLAGRPMLAHIIERVARAERIDAIRVTYPLSDDTALFPVIDAIRTKECRGYRWHDNPNDVVGRYLESAVLSKAELIVRIPCDNPCVDPFYIDLAVEKYLGNPHIYVSTMYRHVRDRIYLDGVGAEVCSMSRLQWLDQATTHSPQYREHPHLLFQDQHLIDGWEQYQRYANVSETIRLDVNDKKDYELIADIYTHFGHNRFTTDEIVAYLTTKEVPHEASR